MNPIPLKIGEVYYLKRVSVYHQCTLRSLHEFKQTAKVDYYSDGEPVICRQSELITKEQYEEIIKQRRKEAYERDKAFRLSEARTKYAELVRLWNGGKRLNDLVKLWDEPPMVVGSKIAAAKRWELISDEPKP